MDGLIRLDFRSFVSLHEIQLHTSGIPRYFWRRLHEKLLDEVYDAHQSLILNRVEYSTSTEEDSGETEACSCRWQVAVHCDGFDHADQNNIFLIDHAWTFELQAMRLSLIQVPGLESRMAELMDLCQSSLNDEELLDSICANVWRFCRYYKLSVPTNVDPAQPDPDSKQLRWYVMDEVGSRIGHSDTPNARIVPFVYVPRGVCYSVLWPTRSLRCGDELLVDYIEHITDPKLRPLHLLPWQPGDFSTEPVEHTFVLTEEFFESHRMQEKLPSDAVKDVQLSPTANHPVPVFTDMDLVRNFLTDPRFRLVPSAKEATILWLYSHFKDYASLTKNSRPQIVSQFPGEQVVTVKDLLAALVSLYVSTVQKQTTSESGVTDVALHCGLTCDWYPVTFNLVHELPSFVAYFQRQQTCTQDTEPAIRTVCSTINCPRIQAHGSRSLVAASPMTQRNLWILKPWNLGRSMGIVITENLNQIIRLADTQPLIASRYVTDPVLFYRADIDANVKFDIRYVVLLRSVAPLRLYVYNVFWLRFANKPFHLGHLDDYSTHFTVMNYNAEQPLKQIHCDEFIPLFNEQYPNTCWAAIQTDIFRVLRELFTVATAFPAPRGIVPCGSSRALYAVDVLLEWRSTSGANTCHRIDPVLCEVNFNPDCTRACQYHPEFFNHVFACLFLDEPASQCNVTRLC